MPSILPDNTRLLRICTVQCVTKHTAVTSYVIDFASINDINTKYAIIDHHLDPPNGT